MKITNWFLNKIAIGGSMILSIFTAIAGIIMLLSVLFNFPPYLGGKTWTLGFIDFKYGIPFTARFATGNIPDSTEFIKTPSGSSLYYFSEDFKEDTGKSSNETILSSNKIITRYENHAEEKDKITINSSKINSVKYFISTKNRGIKILFMFPLILTLLTISFCAWKTARLLDAIQAGMFFQSDNYKRILHIGLAILILQIILFTFSIFQTQFLGYVNINFVSSIPDYRLPFRLATDATTQINWGWIVAGCVFIILSKAFSRGNALQEDQDLTI